MSYSNEQIIKMIKYNQAELLYPMLFEAFSKLTIKQLLYITPKMDRHSGNKSQLILFLLSSLKRKYFSDYNTYQNPIEFFLLDKNKLCYDTIIFIEDNLETCRWEWIHFLSNKLY